MSVAAPPRVSAPKKNYFAKNNFLGFMDFSQADHFLKLRHCWKASDQLRIQLGLDYNVKSNQPTPWAGVRLLVDGEKPDGWAVEVNTDWAVVCTPKVDLIPFTDRVSLPVDLRLGRDFYNNDAPHVEVGLHNSKVALGLLIVALATKHPIHVKRKEAGGFSASLPIKFVNGEKVPHHLNAKAEVDATLNRNDEGLKLTFHQLNAILRLRQD